MPKATRTARRGDPGAELGIPGERRDGRSRTRPRCCARSTAISVADRTQVGGLSASSRTTAARPAAAGCTAGSFPPQTTIARVRAGRTGPAVRAVTRDGHSPGLTIGAPCTIAPRPIPTGGPGPSASAWCGGTPSSERWTGLDTPDFVPGKPPEMRPDWSRHPTGMDALGGDAPFIMEAGRQVPAVRALGAEGRAVAHALRAGGESRRQPALSAADQSGGEAVGRGPATRCTRRRIRAIPTSSPPIA